MEVINLKETSLEDSVAKAVTVLKDGGIVLYPTDTIYGLGVDARNSEAVRRVQELKGREPHKPISILVSDKGQMEQCAVMTDMARTLADAYLPGPLTLVLKADSSMSQEVMQEGTIGIRIPNNPFCLAFAQAFGGPITTTSANRAGHDTPASVEELITHFGNHAKEIALIVDAGALASTTPSTVVSCVEETPVVLREGAITKEALRTFFPA